MNTKKKKKLSKIKSDILNYRLMLKVMQENVAEPCCDRYKPPVIHPVKFTFTRKYKGGKHPKYIAGYLPVKKDGKVYYKYSADSKHRLLQLSFFNNLWCAN